MPSRVRRRRPHGPRPGGHAARRRRHRCRDAVLLALLVPLVALHLERQSALARGVSQRSDAAVVAVARAVENHRVDPRGLGALGDELADRRRAGLLVAGQPADGAVQARCGDNRAVCRVVDDLRGDVPGRPRHDETGSGRGAVDLLADAQVSAGPRTAAQAGCLRCAHGLLARLSGLAANDLALVADTLALVGLRLADLADVGGGLADLLLVDAGHDEAGGRLDGEGDALRGRHVDRVAEPEGELEVGSTGLHAVTGADDLEGLAVALGDAGDHVGDQRAGQPVTRLAVALVVRTLDDEVAVLLRDRDRLDDAVRQGALRPLHRDVLAADADLDAGRDGDRKLADA